MKLMLSEPKYLSDSISIISELVTEARLKITQDKIELIAIDPANVVMVIFKLLSSAFTEYNIDKETEIGINLENFKQILRRAISSDILILTLDEEKNKLRIQLKGQSNRTFNLSLIDLGEEAQKIPNLEFNTKLEMPTTIFENAIEDASLIAESIALITNQNSFIIQSEGDISDAKIEIDKENINFSTKPEQEILSKYSVEYLKKIIKGARLTDNVSIEFGKDYPLRIEYKLIDKMSLTFILAPRVSGE